MSEFFRSELQSLNAYVPGEQPRGTKLIKLNTNESPYPPSPAVTEAILGETRLNLYPDLLCTELKNRFTGVFGVNGENVVFTNGSDEALFFCFLAFCGSKVGAAFADITYGFYPVYADLCRIEKTIIPLDAELKINKYDYVNLNKTIFIANPNAPTGRVLQTSDVEYILDANKNNIVVIDEAYSDFSGISCIPLLKKHNNLVVVGTFSKSRHLAGARLGYLIASTDVVSDIERIKYSINPYNVNTLTQLAGAAALQSDDYYKAKNKEIMSTRNEFSESLSKLGIEVIPSGANFVFARLPGLSGAAVAASLKEKGILIRRFDIERIKDYLRITIGNREQMNALYEAIKEILRKAK